MSGNDALSGPRASIGFSSAGYARAIECWGEAAERAEGPRSVGRGAKPPFRGSYPVTAPSEASDTRRAYLAITPEA